MKPKHFEPLDDYEKELMESIENDEFVSIPNAKEEIARIASYARAMRRKDKRITIRVAQQDLQDIQNKAIESGIPYQTLVAAVLHQYAKGKIDIRI